MAPGPGLRQPRHRAAPHAGAGLPAERGSGRPGHRVQHRRPAGGTQQDLSIYTSAPPPPTPPTMWPSSGRTAIRANSTTAGTPTGRGSLPARKRSTLILVISRPVAAVRLCRSTQNKQNNPSTPLTNAAATAAPAQLARRTAIPTAGTRQSTMSPRRSMISGICRLVVDRRRDPDRTEFRDHSTQAADQRRFIY